MLGAARWQLESGQRRGEVEGGGRVGRGGAEGGLNGVEEGEEGVHRGGRLGAVAVEVVGGRRAGSRGTWRRHFGAQC